MRDDGKEMPTALRIDTYTKLHGIIEGADYLSEVPDSLSQYFKAEYDKWYKVSVQKLDCSIEIGRTFPSVGETRQRGGPGNFAMESSIL